MTEFDVIGSAPLTHGNHSRIIVSGSFFILGESCWSLALSHFLPVRGGQEVSNLPTAYKDSSHFCKLCYVSCIHLFTQKPTPGICNVCQEQKLVWDFFVCLYFFFQIGMKI